MARRVKNPKWGTRQMHSPYGTWGPVLTAEFDQVVPIKPEGWVNIALGKGEIRNLGVAVVHTGSPMSGGWGTVKRLIAVYHHTQVSNAKNDRPPIGTMLLDKDAAEQLAAMLLGAISAYDVT